MSDRALLQPASVVCDDQPASLPVSKPWLKIQSVNADGATVGEGGVEDPALTQLAVPLSVKVWPAIGTKVQV
jgi:hypothetical protein